MKVSTLSVVAICLLSAGQPLVQSTAVAQDAAAANDNVYEVRFKLQLIAQGLQLHHLHWRSYPPLRDRDGTIDGAGLSWRVHLLPFVGEPDLYESFHFDEPWDSAHNRPLLDQIPEIYRLNRQVDSNTRFQAFEYARSLLATGRVDDGISNTIFVAVAGADRGVPWTKPEDIKFDAENPRAGLGRLPGGNLECVMVDGKPLTVKSYVPANVLSALITANRGDVVDAEALRGAQMPLAGNLLSGLQALLGGQPRNIEVQKQLKTIALAMHEHHDVYRRFPLADRAEYRDELGRPKLSWRVHLLQFLNQAPLYKKFHLDEPWDSENNKPLLKFMPQVYRSAGDPADSTTTRMLTIVGDNTVFDPKFKQHMADIRDGTSNTILVIEVGAEKAVPWTKPDDAVFDPVQPLACLGTISSQGIPFVRVDGAVKVFRPNVSPSTFSAMVTPQGGEVFNESEAIFPHN